MAYDDLELPERSNLVKAQNLNLGKGLENILGAFT
jgi:hypothetical protein